MKQKISSVSKKGKDKKEIKISVEEIENGFLITKNIEWQDPKKGYQYEAKKYFSKVDPLDLNEGDLVDKFKSE